MIVYTDGGFRLGRAAWGFIAVSADGEVVYQGSGLLVAPPLTSQRAELFAALGALTAIKEHNFVIVSDSQYLVKGMSEWLPKWIANGWRTSQRRAVENRDVWESLHTYSRNRDIGWRWIARSTVIWNVRVDQLVTETLCTNQS